MRFIIAKIKANYMLTFSKLRGEQFWPVQSLLLDPTWHTESYPDRVNSHWVHFKRLNNRGMRWYNDTFKSNLERDKVS